MSVSAQLVRLLPLLAVGACAEVAVVALCCRALAIDYAVVNGLILALATLSLGAVWGMREQASSTSRQSPALLAAVVATIAAAAFVAPRVYVGPRGPALLTIAGALLLAPLFERGSAILLWPDDARAAGLRRALAIAASPTAISIVAMIALPDAPLSLFVALVALVLLASVLAIHETRREAEAEHAYVEYIRALEVGTDPRKIAQSRAPDVYGAKLSAIDRDVCDALAEFSRQTAIDGRARDQIASARELRTRFMAAMSHELRSPLNSIVGFSQLLENGLEGELTSGQLESVTMVRRSSEELILLLTDVLDLARIEAGRLRLRRGWTPSVEILTEAVSRGRRIVDGRDVTIEAELQPGLPPVHVDQRRIVQAVAALFRHVATSLSKTTIRLRARIVDGPPGPPDQLRIEIHDAMDAIPKAEVERIFDAFRELTAPAGRRVGGLGMALSLSRELIRQHGGEVWAESSAEGTVLCVALPLDGPARER